ncbi:hypothetical protein GCM10025777_56660 [Membranihabitans marinus]
MMQFMFLYIDEIAGKGVGFLTVLEMIFYLSLTFVPMALPISVLISSVMVYGALGERYELATAKSAGISFQRMMLPAFVFALFVSISSFIVSEYIIPVANVKSRSRLYDISKKKPTLNIKAGIFNTAFDGYGIRVKEKSEDGSKIKDVILYDYNSQYQGTSNMILAKDGEMIITPDQKYFVLILNDGKQYQEVKRYNRGKQVEEPFMVTSFDKYQKVFDLSAFELKNTNESYFKNHQKTMNTRELISSIDSTESRMRIVKDRIELEMSYDLPFLESRILKERALEESDSTQNTEEKLDSTAMAEDSLAKRDGTKMNGEYLDTSTAEVLNTMVVDTDTGDSSQNEAKKVVDKEVKEDAKTVKTSKSAKSEATSTKRTVSEYALKWVNLSPSFIDSLPKDSLLVETIPSRHSVDLIGSLRSSVQSAKDQLGYRSKQLSSDRIKIVKSTYELHYKFVLALSCLVFVLIGGSMGSIVRKGGFGYSLLIAIIFFISFIMLSITFRKTAESFRISSFLGAYLPLFILFPISIFLLYKAINDSKLSLDLTRVNRFFRSIGQRLSKSKS